MEQQHIIEILTNHGLRYEIVSLNEKWNILITERGGRIFGPFSNGNRNGLFWVSHVFESNRTFTEFLNSGQWNMGGDRIWIAPEIQFSVTDRNHFWETLKTPSAIDPGNYKISGDGNRVFLTQEFPLQANVIASGKIDLQLKRTIRKAANPLRRNQSFETLMDGIEYFGYEQLLELGGNGDESIVAECWNLLQVIPDGHIYIPMYDTTKGINYYEPVGGFEEISDKGIDLTATGKNRYKVGYKADGITGRIGYSTKWNNQCCLLVRNFPNNPSSIYAEEPPLLPDENGFSVHVYNDDGNSGGFAEIECNMQSIGLPTGYDYSADRVSTWIYVGEERKLNAIAKKLIGFDRLKFG